MSPLVARVDAKLSSFEGVCIGLIATIAWFAFGELHQNSSVGAAKAVSPMMKCRTKAVCVKQKERFLCKASSNHVHVGFDAHLLVSNCNLAASGFTANAAPFRQLEDRYRFIFVQRETLTVTVVRLGFCFCRGVAMTVASWSPVGCFCCCRWCIWLAVLFATTVHRPSDGFLAKTAGTVSFAPSSPTHAGCTEKKR